MKDFIKKYVVVLAITIIFTAGLLKLYYILGFNVTIGVDNNEIEEIVETIPFLFLFNNIITIFSNYDYGTKDLIAKEVYNIPFQVVSLIIFTSVFYPIHYIYESIYRWTFGQIRSKSVGDSKKSKVKINVLLSWFTEAVAVFTTTLITIPFLRSVIKPIIDYIYVPNPHDIFTKKAELLSRFVGILLLVVLTLAVMFIIVIIYNSFSGKTLRFIVKKITNKFVISWLIFFQISLWLSILKVKSSYYILMFILMIFLIEFAKNKIKPLEKRSKILTKSTLYLLAILILPELLGYFK